MKKYKMKNTPAYLIRLLPLLAILVSFFPKETRAQYTDITALAGYTLGETFGTTDGFEVYISDGFTYGLSLSFTPTDHYDVTLSYTRQEASVDVYDYFFGDYVRDIPASVNNIMISGNRNQVVSETGSSVYGGIGIGTAGLDAKGEQYGSAWKFAFDIHAGAKLMFRENVGIKLQAGINFPVQYFGAAFTVGTGGSGAGVSASSTITQVNFLGGLIFRIHKS
jgi:hypothetical protein